MTSSTGIQFNDSTGLRMYDLSVSLTRFLGWQEISANGSVQNAAFGLGKPWWTVSAYSGSNGYFTPQLSYDANSQTLSWSFVDGRTGPCLLVYGTR